MTKAEDLEGAGEFASSMRGYYIIAKALYLAQKELEKVEGPFREVSDIADMQYLQDTVYKKFPIEVLQAEYHPVLPYLNEMTRNRNREQS